MFPPFPEQDDVPTVLRLAQVDDAQVEAFVRHLVEHLAESGRFGLPYFAPSRTPSREAIRARVREHWPRPLDEPLWERAFLLWAGRRVVGHLELRGGRLAAEMHRATLGMGICRGYTQRGHGRRLLETAIGWARDEAKLKYIDLGVFANNEPAMRLYRAAGFTSVGRRDDAFRLDEGVVIDDIQMTLALG